jgi:hypothetical protein
VHCVGTGTGRIPLAEAKPNVVVAFGARRPFQPALRTRTETPVYVPVAPHTCDNVSPVPYARRTAGLVPVFLTVISTASPSHERPATGEVTGRVPGTRVELGDGDEGDGLGNGDEGDG